MSLAAPVQAQVTVGVLIGVTGPGAAQGAGHKNSVSLLPAEIAGQTVTYLMRDDATLRRLIVKMTAWQDSVLGSWVLSSSMKLNC